MVLRQEGIEQEGAAGSLRCFSGCGPGMSRGWRVAICGLAREVVNVRAISYIFFFAALRP